MELPESIQQLEKELKDAGLKYPRVIPDKVKSVIHNVTYTVLPSGKTMICEVILVNGYCVIGESSAVYKENFNEGIGMKISFEKAVRKIYELEGYVLAERLYRGEVG